MQRQLWDLDYMLSSQILLLLLQMRVNAHCDADGSLLLCALFASLIQRTDSKFKEP